MELVVDANILISGLLKDGIARELMFNNYINLYTSEFIFEEFFKHIDELATKADMRKDDLQDLAETLIFESNLKIITKDDVRSFVELAEETSPDPDDVLYFATALKLNCAIWSNDKILKNQKHVKIYSTSVLLKLIK